MLFFIDLIENIYRILKRLLMGGVGMTPSQYLFVCLGGNSSAKIWYISMIASKGYRIFLDVNKQKVIDELFEYETITLFIFYWTHFVWKYYALKLFYHKILLPNIMWIFSNFYILKYVEHVKFQMDFDPSIIFIKSS